MQSDICEIGNDSYRKKKERFEKIMTIPKVLIRS
jgi:hypothetical protein